tara:strand:- start:1258 stop:1470 length:213 start_codon:yes stop_codon:yes gene_type:complete
MNTLPHYASLLTSINQMKSRISGLEHDFKETAAITDLDKELIDALVATANAMVVEATALKSIAYDPTVSK